MSHKIFHHTAPLDRYTSLGSYPLIYIATKHNYGSPRTGVLCCECATRAKHRALLPDTYPEERETIQADIHYEGPPEQCEECNVEIESAYGDPANENP